LGNGSTMETSGFVVIADDPNTRRDVTRCVCNGLYFANLTSKFSIFL
jgi:hypothetical protein